MQVFFKYQEMKILKFGGTSVVILTDESLIPLITTMKEKLLFFRLWLEQQTALLKLINSVFSGN